MSHFALISAVTAAVASIGCATPAMAGPAIANPSFEVDRYGTWPGYRHSNGGAIVGWQGKGGGVNPIWRNAKAQAGPDAPFWDNGKLPHGRQLAFIQGPGKLVQQISGFHKGRRYRLMYRENARIQRQGEQWPRVQVTLGKVIIVSAHQVTPVAKRSDFRTPFYRVESGPFTAPDDGSYELVVQTVQQSGSTTVLLDDFRLVELPQAQE